MSLSAKVLYLRQVITVEPLFFIFASISSSRYFIHVYLYDHFQEETFRIEDSISLQLLLYVIQIIVALLFGSCSDALKIRKPFLLVPFFGEVICLFGYTLCVLFKNQCPAFLSVLLYCLPPCVGGRTLLLMAALAYIADNTNPKELSFRVGVLYITELLSTLAHYFLYDTLYSDISLFSILLVFGFALIGIAYGIFWLKETKELVRLPLNKNMFNPKHVWETLSIDFLKCVGKEKLHIFILLNIICLYRVANHGGHFVLFLLLPLDDYARDLFIIIFCIGVLVLVPLFTRTLHIDNTKLIILGCLCMITSNLLIATSTRMELLFIASFLGIFTVLASLIAVSLVLKSAPANNFGKISALISVFDTTGLLVGSILINDIVGRSLNFPYVGAILFFIFLPAVVWIDIEYRIRNRATLFYNLNDDQERHEDLIL